VRVHPQFLEKGKIAQTARHWKKFGKSASKASMILNATSPTMAPIVLKFFLHVSRQEQRKRLLERLRDKTKNWKFEIGDLAERKLWPPLYGCL